MKVTITVHVEEQANGDMKLGVVTNGAPQGTPKEQAYCRWIEEGLRMLMPRIGKHLGGKTIELVAPTSANN